MRVTAEKVEEQKADILQCALKVFSTKGYTGTKLNDIADDLGITRTPLYYHFGNKDELYVATARHFIDVRTAEVEKIYAPGENIMEMIRQEMNYLLQPDTLLTTRLNEDCRANAEAHPELVAYLNEQSRRLFDMKCHAFQQCLEKGELKPDTQVEDIVEMIYTVHYGINSNGFRTVATEERRRRVVETFLEMIRARFLA